MSLLCIICKSHEHTFCFGQSGNDWRRLGLQDLASDSFSSRQLSEQPFKMINQDHIMPQFKSLQDFPTNPA